jgi:hypothetical protein
VKEPRDRTDLRVIASISASPLPGDSICLGLTNGLIASRDTELGRAFLAIG